MILITQDVVLETPQANNGYPLMYSIVFADNENNVLLLHYSHL